MFRVWSIFALTVLLSVAAAPSDQSQDFIRVESGDSTGAAVQPPQLVTRSFRIANLTAFELAVAEEVQLPADWQLVAVNPRFTLPAGAQDFRLIGISIPASAPPGDYTITYNVRATDTWSVVFGAITVITVRPWIHLEADLDAPPSHIVAGEQYSVMLRVRNHGNAPCRATLEPAASTLTGATLSRNRLTLAGGAEDTVIVTVKSDRGLRAPLRHRVAVNIRVPDFPGSDLQIVAPAAVDVTPRTAQTAAPYHRVPSTLAARYIGNDSAGTVQVEYAGRGALDSRGRYTVDYLVRGPRDIERNLFGLRDEYVIAVRAPWAVLRAGDQMFTLSPLTEQNRLGRGAHATFTLGPVAVGGYAFESRHKYPDVEEQAAFASFAMGRRLTLRANALRKTTNVERRDIGGLAVTTQPWRGCKLNLEYAAGMPPEDRRALSHSALGRLDLHLRSALLSLEKIYAERDFPGYFRDYEQDMAALYLPLSRRLRWQASYRLTAQNLLRDPSQTAALRDRQWQAGFSYAFPFRLTGSLNAEELERADALEPARYGFRERTVLFTLRQGIGALSVEGSARGGRRVDAIEDYTSDFGRFGAGLTFAPGRRQSYYASYQTGYYASAQGPRSDRVVRLRAQYRVIRGITLAAAYQRNNSPERRLFDNNQVDVDATLSLFGGHRLSLRYRRIAYEQSNMPWGTSFMAGYEIPLGIPVGRPGSTGRVRGRVVDEENRRRGVGGALLSLDGTSTRTDGRGYYCFNAVAPGQHFLQVDRASIGFDRTTTIPAPVPLNVRCGRTVSQSLAVTRSGSLRGDVVQMGLSGNASSRGILAGTAAHPTATSDSAHLLPLGGLAQIELELRSGNDVVRTLTDSRGRFSFRDLRPGMWTLIIPPAALPPFHKPEQEHYSLEIAPGANAELPIRVLPVRRTITVVDEGTVPIVRRLP